MRENLTPMDRWILSRLNTLIGHVEAYLDDLKMTEAGREMQDFMDDLSNWYVRRCRERYWGKDMTADKEAAYMTLHRAQDHGADIRPLHPLHVRDHVSEYGQDGG